MCGRFVAATDPDGLVRFFTVDDRQDGDVPASWNVAPTDLVRAVVAHDGRRVLVALRWGLVPAWADDARAGAKLINARAETVAQKPAFRRAFVRRRCLIPADGFYEWRTEADGRKVPHFIHSPGGHPLAFAGLWEVWRDPADRGSVLRTCTIITTAAAPPVAALHDRMPVILEPASWAEWLDRDHRDVAGLRRLLAGAAPELAHHPVSEAVNRPANNGPQLVVRA